MTKPHNDFTAPLGRFEKRSPEQILALIDWLTEGMEADPCHLFEGYAGAITGLNIARSFVVMGDCPEANAAAAAEMGGFAEYALDSTYWTDSGEPMSVAPDDAAEMWQSTVKALVAMSRLARPIRAALNPEQLRH